MGYTHYWTLESKPTDKEWIDVMECAAKIITKARNAYFIQVAWESDEISRKPEVSMDLIRFNGIDEDGHETFYLANAASEFDFCKTARKDYDAIVVAVLIACRVHLSGFSWRSDGWLSEHGDAVQLYNEACDGALEWSNVDPADNDPDRDKVTNVVDMEYERDKRVNGC